MHIDNKIEIKNTTILGICIFKCIILYEYKYFEIMTLLN